MAENSKIAWTTHTFNPWRGCQKVAAGCTNCYADAQSKRNPGVLGIWGQDGTRVIASEEMWRQPLKWNREAQCNCGAAGMGEKQCKWCEGGCQRPRVFCASLADVFEHTDIVVTDSHNKEQCVDGHLMRLDDVRARLFKLIDATPNLDWLLLTKRPENIRKMLVLHCLEKVPGHVRQNEGDGYHIRRRENLWLGTSVAEQADADRNIPLLLQCRDLSPVLFRSLEPLIGPVDITPFIGGRSYKCRCGFHATENELLFRGGDEYKCAECSQMCMIGPTVDWVIVGGESGPHARPCHVDWIRSIVRQCREAGVPCFVKQLGARPVDTGTQFDWPEGVSMRADPDHGNGARIIMKDSKGGDPDEWPEDLRVREIPNFKRE